MKTFKYLLFVGPLLAVLAGCGDIPYPDGSNPVQPPPQPGEPGPPPKTVFASVSGVVDIGSPVSNARVTLHGFKNAEIGKELGSATTEGGRYKIEIVEPFSGPCLISVSGGEYLEVVSQKRIYLDSEPPNQVLYAPISFLKQNMEVNINAWTTFAAARTMVSRSGYDGDEKAIQANLLLMAQHLKNKKAEPESILTAKPVNILVSGLELDDMSLLVTLTHYGLSELATNRYGLTTHRLISILAQDLSNGRFDADGEIQNIAPYLDSQTTRARLVGGIFAALSDLKRRVNLGFELDSLKQAGALFDSLASDNNPALYSLLEKPVPYQQELDQRMLYDVSLKNKTILEANKPIIFSARIRSPHEIKGIKSYLSKISYLVTCADPREAKLYFCHHGRDAEQLTSCVSNQTAKELLKMEEVSWNGDLIRINLNGREGLRSHFFEIMLEVTRLGEDIESFVVSELQIPYRQTEEENRYCSQPHQLSKPLSNVLPSHDWKMLSAQDVPALDWEMRERELDESTWDEANTYCLAKDGGPWRLPTIWELEALYQQKSILGENRLKDSYWSSTILEDSEKGLALTMHNAAVEENYLQRTHFVLCVR